MRKFNLLMFSVVLLLLVQACKPKPKPAAMPADGWHNGTAKFAGDESFQPITEQQLYVFTSLFDKAKPVITYKTENDVLRLLMMDSVRVAMLSHEPDSNVIR